MHDSLEVQPVYYNTQERVIRVLGTGVVAIDPANLRYPSLNSALLLPTNGSEESEGVLFLRLGETPSMYITDYREDVIKAYEQNMSSRPGGETYSEYQIKLSQSLAETIMKPAHIVWKAHSHVRMDGRVPVSVSEETAALVLYEPIDKTIGFGSTRLIVAKWLDFYSIDEFETLYRGNDADGRLIIAYLQR